MATGKKSFILYLDQRGIFEKLTNEQAGLLIKHIYAYCADENPDADFVTDLAFESIKQALKRDLKKFEGIKGKRSEAGRKSAEKRAQQKATNPTSVDFVKTIPTNPTVSVNDSVNVNDNVNDSVNVNENEIKKSKKKGEGLKVIYPFDSDEFKKWWGMWLDYKKTEHKFSYRSPVSELAALKKLSQLANGEESNSIKIIEQSLANGWKGFFKLENNGTNIESNKKGGATPEQLAELWGTNDE